MFELLSDTAATAVQAQAKYGSIVHFKAGPPGFRFETYGIFSATGVQQILSTDPANFRKDGKGYTELRHVIGNGLLNSQDETHARQRRTLQPLFNNRTVDNYTGLIVDETLRITRDWDGVVDVFDAASDLSLQFLAQSLVGTDAGDLVDVYKRSVPYLNAYVTRRVLEPRSLPRTWATPANRKARAHREEFYSGIDHVIQRRRSTSDSGSTDMISLLTRARDENGVPLAHEEIIDHVRNFMVTGRETTANALGFTMHLLGKHPEIQEKCRAEVMAQIGDRKPLASDIIRLPYLTSAIKEALRLYPPVLQMERVVVADTEIDGFHIPAGASTFVSPWVTHRNPEHWPDPERFDPDRFLPEREAVRPRFTYFPWGGGGRACIGQYFSMLQCVLSIAVVLRDYRLETIDQRVRLAYGVSIMPRSPMRCLVTPMRG